MRVKDLRELLLAEDDELEVLVRPKVPGYALEADDFRIAAVTRTLERDTAEPVIRIEVDQEE